MKCLRRYERDTVNIGCGSDQVTMDEAWYLIRAVRNYPRNVLKLEHGVLKFGPFCGVIGTPQVMIEVLPKVHQITNQHRLPQGLLVSMLVQAGYLRRLRTGSANLPHCSQHLLDVFIDDFCLRVRDALQVGFITTYKEIQENLRTIRGRVAMTEHIRRNAADHSHVLCRFDERSIDNSHNAALKHVLGKLRRLSLGQNTRSTVTAILNLFDNVTERPFSSDEICRLSLDRIDEHWIPVFERAGMLMRDLFPDVRLGDVAGSALLFDMEKLFEDVLRKCIRETCRTMSPATFGIVPSVPRRHLSTVTHHFLRRDQAAKPSFELKPDIVVASRDTGCVVALIDAKWKTLNHTGSSHGISITDAYQMNAYAGGYSCRHVALVYPASLETKAGAIARFILRTPEQPILDAIAIDVESLAFQNDIGNELRFLISQANLNVKHIN